MSAGRLNHGGAAFPMPGADYTEDCGDFQRGAYHGPQEGMTLRDYFAAKAMQAIYARLGGSPVDLDAASLLYSAEGAYAMADAMLLARGGGVIRNCTKCGAATEFPAEHSARQGYWCKSCRSKASVESARRHRETKRKNNNAYAQRTAGKRADRTAAYRERHPQKRAAHQAVQTAIRNGSLRAQPCTACGDSKAHAHHDDYSKPLEVIWLCHAHHMERHTMLKARQA